MKQQTMSDRHTYFGWITTSAGWFLTAASVQQWFIQWNPVLQGILFIVTIISTLIFIKRSKTNKTP